MVLSSTPTFEGQITNDGFRAGKNTIGTPTVSRLVSRRSVKDCWLITTDLDLGIRRIDSNAVQSRTRGRNVERKRKAQWLNGRAQHTLERVESRNTCFVRWTFIIYRVVFVYSQRARTNIHAHRHTLTQLRITDAIKMTAKPKCRLPPLPPISNNNILRDVVLTTLTPLYYLSFWYYYYCCCKLMPGSEPVGNL